MKVLSVRQDTIFKQLPRDSTQLAATARYSVRAGEAFNVKYAFRVGHHYWVKLDRALGSVGKVGYFYQPHVQVQAEEVRGVWLTSVDWSHLLESRENIRQALACLHDLGFNTLYPVVWNRGLTLYPSEVARAVTGYAIMPRFAGPDGNRDMLAELLDEASVYGFRVIPWFEYGLMTLADLSQPRDAVIKPELALRKAARDRGWLTLAHANQCWHQDAEIRLIKDSQNFQPDCHVWLNPCHPDVQTFMADLIAELVERYDVDGVQLDDHFGWPKELGYDTLSQRCYTADTGRTAPEWHHDPQPNSTDWVHPEWQAWAATKVTELLTGIFWAMKAKRPECSLSISPNPLGFSKLHYAAHWRTWVEQGLAEEIVLQAYRWTNTDFAATINPDAVGSLDSEAIRFACGHIPVTVGICAGLRGATVMSTSLLADQVTLVRRYAQQFAGFSCFFYESLFNDGLLLDRPREWAVLQRLLPPQRATRPLALSPAANAAPEGERPPLQPLASSGRLQSV